MFIYMRALKCHPAIEQSGQAKSMAGGRVQLWSQDPWWAEQWVAHQVRHSIVKYYWNRILRSLAWPLPQKNVYHRQSQVSSGVESKTEICAWRKCIFFFFQISNQIPTRHVMWQAMMLVEVPGWGLGQLWQPALVEGWEVNRGSDHLM